MASYSNYGNNGKKKTGLIIVIIVGVLFFVIFDIVFFTKIMNRNNGSSSKSVEKRTETEKKRNSSNGKKGERLTVDNEYATVTGGVSFDITFEEFVDKYNELVSDWVDSTYADEGYEYRKSKKRLNQIDEDDFVYYFSDDFVQYGYTYKFLADKCDAGFVVTCDPVTEKIIEIRYMVNAYLYDSGDESRNNWWLYSVPIFVLSTISDDLILEFTSIDGLGKYDKGVVFVNGEHTMENDPNNVPYQDMIVAACTEDSEMYELLRDFLE